MRRVGSKHGPSDGWPIDLWISLVLQVSAKSAHAKTRL